MTNLGIDAETQSRVLISALTLVILWGLNWLTTTILLRNIKDVAVLYRLRKIIKYFFVIIFFILVGRIWYVGVQSIVTFLGLLSVGLAVAFKDLLVDLAGWIFIMWKQPFKAGHRIQIEGVIGDVIDIGAFQFSLLEIASTQGGYSTGRIIHVPNHKVFTVYLANYDQSFPYIWDEIDVVVTFESDWEKSKIILMEIAKNFSHVYDEYSIRKFKKASEDFMLPTLNLEPTMFTSVVDHGVKLSMRFVCEPRNRRATEQKIWEEVLRRLSKEPAIDLAYPTQRFFNHLHEGKLNLKQQTKDML